jgi:malate dehydrogenase (oxaloacetate-decarboxylating)
VFEAVAVVSDGSNLRNRGHAVESASMRSVLADYATVIHDLTGLHARPLPIAADNAAQLAASLLGLPVDFGVVFLVHVEPGRARATQRTLREVGGLPVITDQDTTSIAMASAVLTTLARSVRTPSSGQVVILGAEHLPKLRSLLMACGVGDIISWNQVDAPDFPLHSIARSAHAVVDLLGGSHEAADGRVRRPVIAPDDPSCRLLVLPGLLAAIAHAAEPVLDITLYRACAVALATSTPSGKLLPDLADSVVADTVACAAARALRHR